jgi:hypothetical protein
MHTLVRDLDMEIMAYRPCKVFLNGDYWGIHNLRERTNDDYINQHHDIDKDSLDIIRNKYTVIRGDNSDYLEMYDFIKYQDMTNESNYEYINSIMDIDNYIQYMLSEMYFVNTDWFHDNMKFWRSRNPITKWRWILFDTDQGFGCYTSTSYNNNMLNVVTDENRYPSFMFNGLIQNQGFRNTFLNTYADFANTIFKPTVVINVIDSIKSLIESEMPAHIARWKNPGGDWNGYLQILRDFANQRLPYMTEDFIEGFNLSGMTNVSITINDNSGGRVQLNTINIKTNTWSGDYFLDIPIILKALPKPGYSFVGWSGSIVSTDIEIAYTPTATNNIVATFQQNPPPPDIVINEINYNSNINFEIGDWVELYNNSTENADLSNWYFSDGEDIHKFVIPSETILNSGSYLILAEDTTKFKNFFPSIQNIIGNFRGAEEFNFGLSGGGEPIRLYSYDHQIVDTLEYDDDPPWPSSADGDGNTLELRNPQLDNKDANNWCASSVNLGTPGLINSCFSENIELDVKVLLEGPYNQSSGLMNTLSQNNIPTNQPFNQEPWNYDGTETVESIPENIVDWILVELIEESGDLSRQYRKAGFLKTDSQIVELDGYSNIVLPDVRNGTYDLIIYHRNHLAVMSNSQITVN